TRTEADGNASVSVEINGIEPPMPISIGVVPSQAIRIASRAASYAGPSAGNATGSPPSMYSTSTDAPHGVLASIWPRNCSNADAHESPGARRIEIIAEAVGNRVLLESRTAGASIPVTVSA